jgi:TP901 family phage tail tape measure protein
VAASMLGDLVINLIGDDTSLLNATRRTTSAMEDAATVIVDGSARIGEAQAAMASEALKAAGVFTSAMGEIETAVASATTEILAMSQKEAESVLQLRQAMLAVDEAIQSRIMAEQQLDAAVAKTLASQTDELAINNELAAASLQLQEAMLRETVATEELAAAHARSSDEIVAAAAKQQAAMKTAADVQVASARAVQGAMREEAIATQQASIAAEKNAARMSAVADSIGRLGKISAIALAGIAAYSIKAATDFQAKMLLIHTQAGDTGVDLKKLGDQVMALAPLTGIGPDKLADGLYHVESAGFRGAEAMQILTAAAKAAAIGQSDMETTTQAMIGVMAVGFKDVRDAADAQAYLNTTVGIGDMRMQQLSSAIATNVLPTFAVAGLGMRDFSAALATVTDNVTPANMAATRLRMTVALLGSPTKAAAKALEAVGLSGAEVTKALAHRDLLEKYGVSVSKLSMDLRKPDGLLIAIMDLKDHLKAAGLDATEQAAVIERAFGGGRTSAAIQTLMLESDRLKSKYDALGTSATRQAAAQKAWAEQEQNFKQQTHQLGASLQVLGIQLGEKLLPPLQKFVQFLTTHQSLVIGFLKGLLVFLGLLTVAWIAEGIAMIAANWELILAIVLIAAIVYGIYELVKHWGTVWGWIKRIAVDVWHAIYDATMATLKFFKGIGVWIWQNMIYPIVAAFEYLYKFIIIVWHAIYQSAMWLYRNVILPIVHYWQWAWGLVIGYFTWVINFWRKWWPLVLVVFAMPIAVLIHLWHQFHNTIISAVKAAWDFIKGYYEFIWNGIKTLAVLLWHGIYQAIWVPIQDIWHAIVAIWNSITNWLSGRWRTIVAYAKAAWALFKSNVIQPVESLINWFIGWGTRINNAISKVINSALTAASNFAKKFFDVGKGIVMGIINGVINQGGALIHKLEDLANSALKAAKKFLGISSPSKLFADEVGKNVALGIAVGIDKNAKIPTATLTTMVTGMVRTSAQQVRSGPVSPAVAATPYNDMPQPVSVYVDGKKLFDFMVQRSQRNKRRNDSTFLV